MATNELCHHGIKGQKWGVRRYQNSDGSLTPAGQRRYGVGSGRIQDIKDVMRERSTMSLSELSDYTQTLSLGKNTVDTYINRGTTLSRIQLDVDFQEHPFYATYRQHDTNKYVGLFGKNLVSRARRAARESGDTDLSSEDLVANQLKFKTRRFLRIPSDDNASGIMRDLATNNDQFRQDLSDSIHESRRIMRRPTQQRLFARAERALRRDPSDWSDDDRQSVYEAFNLSLTNHTGPHASSQATFYDALRQRGYGALVDVNDRNYSSYHASRPLIVFDTGGVSLDSVAPLSARDVAIRYPIYNTERIVRDALSNVLRAPVDSIRTITR